MNRAAGAFVWGVVALEVVGASTTVLGILPSPPATSLEQDVIMVILTAAFGLVGARVVTRRPRNPVGWLLWVQATLIALSGVGMGYAQLRPGGSPLPGAAWVAWAGGFGIVLFLNLTALVLPLLFPDGHLPSPRWRPALVLALVSSALVVIGPGQALRSGALDGFSDLANPIGIAGIEGLVAVLRIIGAGLIFVCLPLSVAAQVTRFRHGSTVERQQAKWFAAAVAVPAILLACALTIQTAEVLWIGAVTSLGMIPLAVGVAILRYRLYEIDRIVSRTVGWALITGILAGVFAGLVVGLQALLSSLTQGQTLAVAASTLVAAAAFQPVRRRVQRAVDRRFDRARYSADLTAAQFAVRLRDQVDLPALEADVEETIRTAMRPASTAVWVRRAG